MKRVMLLSIVSILSFLLVSCKEEPLVLPVVCDSPEVLSEESNTCELPVDVPLIQEDGGLTLLDYSEDYEVHNRYLKTYKKVDDVSTYVDIEEFIFALSDVLIPLDIVKEEVLEVGVEDAVYYNYIRFDAESDIIETSNMYLIGFITKPVPLSYDSKLYVHHSSGLDISKNTIIDLNEYDYGIELVDEKYYIPLELANLFLTGYYLNVLESGDNLIVFDMDGFSRADYTNEFETYSEEVFTEKMKDSEQFLKLYLNYFYGLSRVKFSNEVSSFVESFDIDESLDYQDYYSKVDRLFIELDDRHSALIYAGDSETQYIGISEYEEGTRLDDFEVALDENYCRDIEKEYEVTKDGNRLYVTLNGFSEATHRIIPIINSQIHDVEEVIFDLRCNTGGSSHGMLEALTLLTNNPIVVPYYLEHTDVAYTISYVSETPRALNADIYVLTSNATFSAGNLFASIVKDQDLGLILGQKTGGGGYAIMFGVLPDGSVVVNSSNLAVTKSNSFSIEQGRDPHIELDVNEDISQLELGTAFDMIMDYQLLEERTGDTVTISLEHNIDVVPFETLIYKVYIRNVNDPDSNIENLTFEGEFNYSFTLTDSELDYEIIVEVIYTFDYDMYRQILFDVDYSMNE